jgi:hypothetical protein
MTIKSITIYVKLLNEGIEVYRPVNADCLSNGCYQLKGFDIFDPEDEQWEFLPGSLVKATTRESDGESILVASSPCVTKGNTI